ncbi:MAG: hypothetical protein JKY65_27860 [Planctomycetes bacterium]|nr:hypothetical protein [Planctomycetota bacterium]
MNWTPTPQGWIDKLMRLAAARDYADQGRACLAGDCLERAVVAVRVANDPVEYGLCSKHAAEVAPGCDVGGHAVTSLRKLRADEILDGPGAEHERPASKTAPSLLRPVPMPVWLVRVEVQVPVVALDAEAARLVAVEHLLDEVEAAEIQAEEITEILPGWNDVVPYGDESRTSLSDRLGLDS